MSAAEERLRSGSSHQLNTPFSNVEAVHYLAMWHLDRQSFQQARQYFGYLTSVRAQDPEVWLCLSISCALAGELEECAESFKQAGQLLGNMENVRVLFCRGLLYEVRKEYTAAFDTYMRCLVLCGNENEPAVLMGSTAKRNAVTSMDIRGEALLRIAVVKKDTGNFDFAMQICDQICSEVVAGVLKAVVGANALCLKGVLLEIQSDFPNAEVVYRSALQIIPDHALALERLGRVYLRYRETIPAAVQCFFKVVEASPSNHTAWYLLGRCYAATGQYSDAGDAYNRAVNLNPNDAQVWCSLGVLYYAFGQYREALGMLARAVKLNPGMSEAWYNIGALYDMCGQAEDAELAYQRSRDTGVADRFLKVGIANAASLSQQLPSQPLEVSHNDPPSQEIIT